jgi:prophage maintenance system killer protein
LAQIVYPTLKDVIKIHDEAMVASGYEPARLVSPEKIESAIARSQQLASYEPGADLVAQAVVLAVGISQAQAFLKGNKRAASGVADAFLDANGLDFSGGLTAFSCWLICIAGDIHNDYVDTCIEHLGLDLTSELDWLARGKGHTNPEEGRRVVSKRFEVWLRANVSPRDTANPEPIV